MIDRETVDRIINTADIVEVVSDFVSLRRRGANYIGLCPFHNEKTPSFTVSPSKQICHCFGCGKGGSPVNFIMEHEQLSYSEALRYLARKYHIEIKEREMTDQDRAEQSERESLLMVNDLAEDFFEKQLHDTENGKDIGLAYFNERGFSPETIKKFRLGYSPDDRAALFKALTEKGINKKYLFETGLCIDDKHDSGYDRFRGRVMFPVLNVAGKVIAFGGRIMSTNKETAKYVNSPESLIYKKHNELYGLFQAKRAIVNQGKCFLVEGYTDVISMHQAGIENVVASSGTSLTEGQIRMIHRFTENVTVLYDGDNAGIKASLRGIDMLLAEGLNIKVVLLPEGEDPDSFARSHNATEFQQFIAENESDFITFKMQILLQGTENDPIKRSKVIEDVVNSIAVIPSKITRSVYAKECSDKLGIAEDVILDAINKAIYKNKEKSFKEKQREQDRQNARSESDDPSTPPVPDPEPEVTQTKPLIQTQQIHKRDRNKILLPCEKNVIRYIAKFGMCYLCDTEYDDGTKLPTSVIEFIRNELDLDALQFTNPIYDKIYQYSLDALPEFEQRLEDFTATTRQQCQENIAKGIEELRIQGGDDFDAIAKKEEELKARENANATAAIDNFRQNYLEKLLCSSIDNEIREETLKLISEKHQLSKIHTQYTTVTTEQERLLTLVPESIYNWKNAIVMCQILDIQKQLKTATDEAIILELLKRQNELNQLRKQLAKLTGERVVTPIF